MDRESLDLSLDDDLSGQAMLPPVMSQPGLYSRGVLCRSSDGGHAGWEGGSSDVFPCGGLG